MTQPAGWYEDPNDPDLMRYFDGVVWSDRTMPKIKPGLDDSRIGAPTPPAPAGAQPGGQQWQSPQPGQTPQQWQGPYPPLPGQPAQPWQQPAPGHGPYPGYPVADHRTYASDGRLRSGWWRRVGANLIDSLLLSVLMLPVMGLFLLPHVDELSAWFQELVRAAEADAAAPPDAPQGALRALTSASVVSGLIYLAYEIIGLARWGRTVGRMATGIAVQRIGRHLEPTAAGVRPVAQGIGWRAAAVRTLIKQIQTVLGAVPVIGFFASLFALVDSLWPLWDGRKQAIHDKPAETEVVRTR